MPLSAFRGWISAIKSHFIRHISQTASKFLLLLFQLYLRSFSHTFNPHSWQNIFLNIFYSQHNQVTHCRRTFWHLVIYNEIGLISLAMYRFIWCNYSLHAWRCGASNEVTIFKKIVWKVMGGGTKDENSESLLACICNTCISSLRPNNSGGEQKCGCFEVRGGDAEALIQNVYQATPYHCHWSYTAYFRW